MTDSIFSPYRICPLGAHVDHQGGEVLGRTIGIGTTLEYEPLDSARMQISSDQFGEAEFEIGDLDREHWTRYAQAAALVLSNLQRGLRARVRGALVAGGLSSSASFGLAFLQALARVNDLELTKERLVELEYRLEHDILGLQMGLLDPMTIVHGRKEALLHMDTRETSVSLVLDSPSSNVSWIVAYSGVSRELTKSGFNRRVEECYQAALTLKEGAQVLSDVPRELFEEKKASLPEHLRRRAEHFFGEVDRVRRGVRAWQDSDFDCFGRLMEQSCQSSIYNYESGSAVLIELHELVSGTAGIYGSRFSGGGYGGCVVALAQRESAPRACEQITERFSSRHPELPSRAFVVGTADGLKVKG